MGQSKRLLLEIVTILFAEFERKIVFEQFDPVIAADRGKKLVGYLFSRRVAIVQDPPPVCVVELA